MGLSHHERVVTVDTTRLDKDLIAILASLAEDAGQDGTSVFHGYEGSPEYRELKKLGAFSDVREYINGDAHVRLSYEALKVARGEKPGSGRKLAETAAALAGTFTGAAAREFSDIG